MPSVGRWPAAADRATRMTLGQPRDSTIGIVGDGFGSAFVYTTAVYLGFRPEQITVFGPSGNPVATYQQFAYNLGQTILRSESESHFLPADWPTFAQLDAWARRSLAPLFRSVRRRYNPGVAEILADPHRQPAGMERQPAAGADRLATARARADP